MDSLLSMSSKSALHLNKSLPNVSYTFLNQLFWWRKLRKAKTVSNTNSFSNICVIMKSDQSCVTQCFHSQTVTSVTPAVSFINRDEGFVSMQLMDRIMINDNELYSMGLQSDYNTNNNFESNCLEMSSLKNESKYSIEDQNWFYGSLSRQKSVEMLESHPIGSFIIRYSMTQRNCFAMTLRVATDYHMSGVAHYLIIRNDFNGFQIKGFTKEFESLQSLIIHHSILKELLPCPLLLPSDRLDRRICQKYSSAFETRNNCKGFEDILVDIDSDPNYIKILNDFRKTLYQMN